MLAAAPATPGAFAVLLKGFEVFPHMLCSSSSSVSDSFLFISPPSLLMSR